HRHPSRVPCRVGGGHRRRAGRAGHPECRPAGAGRSRRRSPPPDRGRPEPGRRPGRSAGRHVHDLQLRRLRRALRHPDHPAAGGRHHGLRGHPAPAIRGRRRGPGPPDPAVVAVLRPPSHRRRRGHRLRRARPRPAGRPGRPPGRAAGAGRLVVVGEVAVGADLLVIGGGPGGYAAALRGAAAGRSVTLVERDRIGGGCLNVGCIPSKALIHVADTAGLPAEAAAIGVDLTAAVDLDRAQAWIGDVVGRLTGGVGQLLGAAGVTVATGTARFATARRVAVTRGDDATFYEFKSLILATGSRPVELPALPFDGERILDSTAALALRRVPARLTVVGGGYIGVELGGAWAKLGAEVTIVELADQLLPGMPT